MTYTHRSAHVVVKAKDEGIRNTCQRGGRWRRVAIFSSGHSVCGLSFCIKGLTYPLLMGSARQNGVRGSNIVLKNRLVRLECWHGSIEITQTTSNAVCKLGYCRERVSHLM